MEHEHRHLIIGSGMTGHAAAAAIRARDPKAPIAMIGDEPHAPYARPPLTKALWSGQKTRADVFLPPVEGLAPHSGRRAVALDPAVRAVRDDKGDTHRYERLLLATGARPRRLPADAGRVIYLRTLSDYDRLAALPADAEVTVIGGGFIGSEIAASLSASGRRVTLVLPEEAVGARAWPGDLAAFVTSYFEQKGVRVLRGRTVAAVEADGPRARVRTSGGDVVASDAVVAGLGVEPDVELARAAGLAQENGIVVDEAMRTSAPDVYAADDVARFPSAGLGGRVRVEHEDAALSTGRVAGENMAGGEARYETIPFFYSDLFDLGYEAVGRLDPRLTTLASWRTPFREGIVAYLGPDDRIQGLLLWGIFGQVDAARGLIGRPAPARREELGAALGG
jgi:NADPH-dependent 2,4-dienoyl-CoA reductase/sulfur reductase-like enzyme